MSKSSQSNFTSCVGLLVLGFSLLVIAYTTDNPGLYAAGVVFLIAGLTNSSLYKKKTASSETIESEDQSSDSAAGDPNIPNND